ncbi:MAG: response regulator [Desulfatiglandaceae bacterium]
MRREVLLVDDVKAILNSIREGLEEYQENFSVVTAGNGKVAIEKLKERQISLVVTDLKMPETDGFSLLSHIMAFYPDIPVIVMTGYSNAEMERLAQRGGAIGYIAKPFKIEDLAKKILTALRRESDGGKLHSVSSGMFLQLIEMEQKTCTIRIQDRDSEKRGVLFFREGELMDSRINGLKGLDAAYTIFGWEEVNLSIQNSCPIKKKRLEGELQAILLEAMRRKDEREKRKPKGGKNANGSAVSPGRKENGLPDATEIIRRKIGKEMGTRCGVEGIRYDNSWDGLLGQMRRIGKSFNYGSLRLVYMDQGGMKDMILLSGEKTISIFVNNKCPRDRIVKVLMQ